MAPAILSYFGWGSSSSTPAVEEPVRALPSTWYTSQEMYELERRAIFSRKWLLVTHKLRLAQPGDWLRYDIAGNGFLLALDREGNINAFHNVCRHRAYPVVEEDKGTARIFACRYHGWSYGLNGKLAKAPRYDELAGFDKSKNGLFPIHTHIDNNGFVWINLDSKQKPEIAWEDDFELADRQEELEDFNFDDYEYDHSWEMKGDFNWKILADNYNDSYHYSSTDSEGSEAGEVNSDSVDVQSAWIKHTAATTAEQEAAGLSVASTYFYPNASLNVSPHFFMIQRFNPNSPTSSTMKYEVYRNTTSSEEDFQKLNKMYKRIVKQDKELCETTQRNIDAGVFVNGEMHPRMEKGALYFQKLSRDLVTEHHAREQKAKAQIWPARQSLPGEANVSKEDLDFCSGLACAPSNQEALAW